MHLNSLLKQTYCLLSLPSPTHKISASHSWRVGGEKLLFSSHSELRKSPQSRILPCGLFLLCMPLIRAKLDLEIRLHSRLTQHEILQSVLHLWRFGLLVCKIWLSVLAPDFNFPSYTGAWLGSLCCCWSWMLIPTKLYEIAIVYVIRKRWELASESQLIVDWYSSLV